MTPEANQVSGWSLEKLQRVHQRMLTAQLPATSVDALTLNWLQGRDVRTIENVEQLTWLLEQVQRAARRDGGPLELAADWSGSVQPPVDGEYTFSVCPVNLNFEANRHFCRQTIRVRLGGEQVVHCTADSWNWQSEPVTLSADQKTPLRIELSYSCSEAPLFASHPAVAILRWQGPGMERQLVPASALWTVDGGENGLEASYVLKLAEGQRQVSRVDAGLNFIWHHGNLIDPEDGALHQALADQLFAVAQAPSTLAQWESDQAARQQEWAGAHWALLQSLDAPARKQWAGTLVAHPVLLADCPRQAAVALYHSCRFGGADAALELFGHWAQEHPDVRPAWAMDFYDRNRADYRTLAGMMVWHYRPHLQALEQRYLELSDGSCSLPVAYTLSYGYWVQNQIHQWIEQLDTRLDGAEPSGDSRVSWLLARAQAEAIRRGRAGRHWRTMERSLAGLGWIQEAALVAQSEAVRLGVFRQWAARLAADENFAAAESVLDTAAQRCTSSASTSALSEWRQALDQLKLGFEQRHAEHEALAQQAYVAQLRDRRQSALDQGDSAAVSRYDQLLAEAGAGE
jgi:hypothetical protein